MVSRPTLQSLTTACTQCSEKFSPCERSTCSEADTPTIDPDAAQSCVSISSHSDNTPLEPVGDMVNSATSSRSCSSEHRLESSAPIDARRITTKTQGRRIVEFTEETETNGQNQNGEQAANSSNFFTHIYGVAVNPDINITIEGPSGSPSNHTVYTCHHVADTDMIILSQRILEELREVMVSRDNKLKASRSRIMELETALKSSEQEKDTAIKSQHIAQRAEARAVSTLEVVAQEKTNAQSEIRLLHQALKLAQRGYGDAKEVARTLRTHLKKAYADSDKAHEAIEALHEVLSANKIEMMNMRKDREFAKTQSRGYQKATQQLIDGHEAVRLQLLEQNYEVGRDAAEKIAELRSRNAELEDVLAAQMAAKSQSCRRDLHIEIPSSDSPDSVAEATQDNGQESEWGLDLSREQQANGIEIDLESGPCLQTATLVTDEFNVSSQQGMRRSSWGVKSLRLRGVWGGRVHDNILPR